MKKHWRNRIISASFAALFLFGAGCERLPAGSTPAGSAVPAATPQETLAASPSPAAVPPTPGASPTAELSPTPSPAPDGYDIAELDGIAGPGDVLPIYETFEEALAANAEAPAGSGGVVGWITIPGTVIDYPVCRSDGTDDGYYLDHNVEGRVSKYGAIFMDSRNADAGQQQHVLIYGHNMRNGTMFHDLMNYKQQAFFDEHRYISLYWDGTETVWQVYLASTIASANVNFALTRFESGDHFAEFIADMREYAKSVSPSIIDETVTVGPNDQVLTLSICTYAPPEAREQNFVVQARRIR